MSINNVKDKYIYIYILCVKWNDKNPLFFFILSIYAKKIYIYKTNLRDASKVNINIYHLVVIILIFWRKFYIRILKAIKWNTTYFTFNLIHKTTESWLNIYECVFMFLCILYTQINDNVYMHPSSSSHTYIIFFTWVSSFWFLFLLFSSFRQIHINQCKAFREKFTNTITAFVPSFARNTFVPIYFINNIKTKILFQPSVSWYSRTIFIHNVYYEM